MLKLIHTEFLKLRRRKFIFIMMLAALVMPFFALLYFRYFGHEGIEPMQFYRISAFGYTLWIVLPFILGILSTVIMYDENRNDMLKQLWIVPVSKMGYFFSKFFIVLIYSVCFMLITAVFSVAFSVLSGYVSFDFNSVLLLFGRSLQTGVLVAFAVLPVVAAAAMSKGYILPVFAALIYNFLGFFTASLNMYLHPLSSTAVIIMPDTSAASQTEPANIPLALLCIGVWGTASVLTAYTALKKRK
ncbi:MAG: ABC transporter permease [Oscillospiraceae bacterium]|nr:ABC transporter permease [Oscillospiraceae bacterium]